MPAKTCHSKKSECPIANSLDILGDRWTLLILRDMLFGNAHEYHQFLAAKEGISTNILANRLQELQANGLIESRLHTSNKKRKLYYLTNSGKDMIYILLELSKWSQRHLADKVKVPRQFAKMMQTDPDALVEAILVSLQDWENENLNK